MRPKTGAKSEQRNLAGKGKGGAAVKPAACGESEGRSAVTPVRTPHIIPEEQPGTATAGVAEAGRVTFEGHAQQHPPVPLTPEVQPGRSPGLEQQQRRAAGATAAGLPSPELDEASDGTMAAAATAAALDERVFLDSATLNCQDLTRRIEDMARRTNDIRNDLIREEAARHRAERDAADASRLRDELEARLSALGYTCTRLHQDRDGALTERDRLRQELAGALAEDARLRQELADSRREHDNALQEAEEQRERAKEFLEDRDFLRDNRNHFKNAWERQRKKLQKLESKLYELEAQRTVGSGAALGASAVGSDGGSRKRDADSTNTDASCAGQPGMKRMRPAGGDDGSSSIDGTLAEESPTAATTGEGAETGAAAVAAAVAAAMATAEAAAAAATAAVAAAALGAQPQEESGFSGLFEAFGAHLHAYEQAFSKTYRNGTQPNRIILEVDRNGDLVGAVLDRLAKVRRQEMLRMLRVKFNNEDGVDEGGLASELFTQFYERLDAFAVEGGARLFCPPVADSAVLAPNRDVPTDDDAWTLYKGVGVMLFKTITAFLTTSQRLVPPRFAPGFVIDYLLERGPHAPRANGRTPLCYVLEDLKSAFGPNSFPLNAWNNPNFSLAGISYGLLTETDEDAEKAVTRENLEDFTRLFAEMKLVAPIKHHLEAMKEGFTLLSMTSHLRLFQRHDLLDYISGRYDFTAVELWQCVSFEDEEGADASWADAPFTATRTHFEEAVLQLMSADERREFLRWSTGYAALPAANGKAKAALLIKINPLPSEGRDRPYPLAHTCDTSVEMPAFGSARELMDKLFEGIRGGGHGFQMR